MMEHNNLFGCIQVLMCGQMEGQPERQVQKQGPTNMHCTANIHATAHNVNSPVIQQFLTLLRMPRIGYISNSIYINK